ncbi:hypothetical protein [Spiroplasma endosymbiont of Cantharis nigra]|uniref:hypothetical protein n=1 Tax=Spiroplasma endosymbiont of Cantharis nigra TaxID=3066278 RepID=UPI0030D00CBA
MIKLLSLIGTLSVSSSAIAPIATMEQNINNKITSNDEVGTIWLSVKNEKHFDKDGKIIVGTEDYKEVLIKAVEDQRNFNRDNNVTSFSITGSTTRFPGTGFDGSRPVGYELERVINAKEYEILNMNVTVDKLDNWGNYKYAIAFEAIADGETVNGNLYGYQVEQSLTDFQIKPGYNVTLDTQYTISESMDYTDNEYKSNISLPNLGIDYLAGQIVNMFNYSGNSLNSETIKYINTTLKLNIGDVKSLNVYKAINKNSKFEKGSVISNNELVNDKYFYVSFESNDANGTFNMLVHK